MRATNFVTRYGPWALVTGAAEGLGAELARQCAARGLSLVLLDRQGPALAARADELRRASGVAVRTIEVDLARPDLLEVVAAASERLEVGLLINNAAWAGITAFFDAPLSDHLGMIDVNVRAPLALAHHFGRAMIARGRGGIVFVSSVAALQGTALAAAYAATKAHGLILGEGLWYEAARHGVDVLAVMPGTTRTPGLTRSRPQLGPSSPIMQVEPVATATLEALGQRASVIPGRLNRLASALLTRVLPRATAVRTVSRVMERLYPNRLAPRSSPPRPQDPT